MLDRNFDATFRAELQHKDLKLAVEASRDLGLYLPAAVASHNLLNEVINYGWGKDDGISVLRVLEKTAKHTLKGDS